MTNSEVTYSEATYSELIKELDAEFAGMEGLLNEEADANQEADAMDEQEAATDIVKLLEQARTIVAQVLSAADNSGDSGGETDTQIIKLRLDSMENSLATIDAQLATIREELTILRQLLAQT